MKYTNKEISFIYEGLIFVRNSQIVFPAKVSYAIVRNLRILEPIYQDIETTKAMIVRDNGVFLEDKGYYAVRAEKVDFVNKEFESLANVQNEINLSMIKMSDIADMNLSVSMMDGLYYMIEDEG